MNRISIIMGIYNCADTLAEAIDSILAQTYANWELIMCDDASTDDTYAIAAAFVKQHPEKMTLIRNDANLKLSATLNHCLRHATGDFIARMDADDLSEPDRLEKQLSYLQAHPECDMVGTAMRVFGHGDDASVRYPVARPSRFTLIRTGSFFHATILARRHVYDRLQGYTVDTLTTRGQDFDLWIRFFAAGFQGHNLQAALYRVREDEAQLQRKRFAYRLHAVRMRARAVSTLQLPAWYYLFVLEPLIAALVPKRLLKIYYRMKLQRPVGAKAVAAGAVACRNREG